MGRHITASTCPGFSTLTALQQLILKWGSEHAPLPEGSDDWYLQPSLLAGLTNLQLLKVTDVQLFQGNGPDSAAQQLLSALPALQQLQVLSLFSIRDIHGAPLEAYSALTSSRSLRHFQMHYCYLGSDSGIWQHIFPASRPALQLRALDLTSLNAWFDAAYIDTPALAAIAECCPRLRSLNILLSEPQPAEGPALQLLPLLQLQSLAQLRVLRLDDACAAKVLVHMTRLRGLWSGDADDLTTQGLLQLTVLQHLTQLGLGLTHQCKLGTHFLGAVKANCRQEAERYVYAPCYVVQRRAPPGSPPDVWQQVQAWCSKDQGAAEAGL